MTAADVQRLAGRGEGPTLEFKQRTPDPAKLAKELIAFANTNGGRLLIGVEDDGRVVGVKDASEEEFALQNALTTHCAPPFACRVERVVVTKKRDVIIVAVPRSKSRPHFLIESMNGNSGTAYVRVGDRSIEATPSTLELMVSKTEQNDIQFEFGQVELRLMQYLEQYGQIKVESFARFAAIPVPTAQRILVTLTQAGVLKHHLDFSGDYFTLSYDGEN